VTHIDARFADDSLFWAGSL